MIENGIYICGYSIEYWNTHTIDTSNTVNGKPVYYWKNIAGGTIPAGAGEVILSNCTGVTMENQNTSNGSVGIQLGFSSSCNITNNTIRNNWDGIYLDFSNNCTITGNTISNNNEGGIVMGSYCSCTITGNTISNNNEGGIVMGSYCSCTITGNTISNNNNGIYLWYSSNNNIHYNNIYGNSNYGINSWSSDLVNATYNYWASPSGPYHPTLNPNGTGDDVSDNVNFIPWLTTPVKGGTEEEIATGENEIDAIDEADTSLEINTTTNNTVRVISYEESPVEEPNVVKSTGKYVQVEVENKTNVEWPMAIKIYYAQEDLNNTGLIEEQIIGIYFYNETSGEWQLYNDTGVNTTDIIVNGKHYAGYAWANAWHLTNMTIGADNSSPEINNVNATPLTQIKGGYVNITCNVTDNTILKDVSLWTILNDTLAFIPKQMKNVPGTNIYYYNSTYSGIGRYDFYIHANDTAGNNQTSPPPASHEKFFIILLPQYILTASVDPSGGGSVTLNPSGGTYDYGTVVTLTAVANTGYQFDYWSGDASGSNPSIQITMDGNKSIIAHFTEIPPQQYTLITSVDPSESGSIILDPSGGTYDEGTIVTATVNVNSGYQFDHWSGDASGSNPSIQITMNNNRNIVAHFVALAPPNQPPTVAITSPANGTTVSGTVSISGTANDTDGDVQSAQVKIGTGSWTNATGTTSWSYDWDTTNVANGSHTIYARSYDGTNYSNISSVTVTVNNISPNHKPTVSIIFPSDGMDVKKTFTIHGAASDEDGSGTIQKVEIKIDEGEWKVVNGTTSWNYTWDSTTVDNGDYVIQARSYDGQEYSNIDSVMVKVNNEKGGGSGIPGFEMAALIVALGAVMWMKRKRTKP